MSIRKAEEKDIDEIMRVTKAAKETMRARGNSIQWAGGYPDKDLWLSDIKNGNAYVVERSGRIAAVFALIFGEDSTYGYIEDGSWLNDEPYATIHRAASDGSEHGIITEISDYCSLRTPNLRADTHEINTVMKNALLKNGFARCGIIYLADGTQRVAFHKICRGIKTEESL